MTRYWVTNRLEPEKHLTELQRLRARRTPNLRLSAREAAYTIGLTQAEDLWLAADGAEPLADPILRYYGARTGRTSFGCLEPPA